MSHSTTLSVTCLQKECPRPTSSKKYAIHQSSREIIERCLADKAFNIEYPRFSDRSSFSSVGSNPKKKSARVQEAFHQLFIFVKCACHCGVIYQLGKEMFR